MGSGVNFGQYYLKIESRVEAFHSFTLSVPKQNIRCAFIITEPHFTFFSTLEKEKNKLENC